MTITYETLFEVLRREKSHDDLQKLEENFFQKLQEYLQEKKMQLEKPRIDQFMDGYENEQTAIRTQLSNIKKLTKDIFDRRERKIIDMAINKAKTGSNIIDTSSLLSEEKAFFESQVATIGSFRSNVLEGVLNPQTRPEAQKPVLEAEKPKDLNMAHNEENLGLKKIQVIEPISKFVGVDLEIYGPYNESEEVELQPEIADMLIKTNKAKMVE